jgi:hypothetical protein
MAVVSEMRMAKQRWGNGAGRIRLRRFFADVERCWGCLEGVGRE